MTYYCIDPGDYYFDFGDAVASLLSDEAVFVGGMSPFIEGDNDPSKLFRGSYGQPLLSGGFINRREPIGKCQTYQPEDDKP